MKVQHCLIRSIPYFVLVVGSLGLASVTPTRSQRLKEIPKCLQPKDLLERVGQHTSDAGLSSLVLIRLSKQLLSENNRNPGTVSGDSTDRDILTRVVECLGEQSASLEDRVEGTKACAIISRLLQDSQLAGCADSLWTRSPSISLEDIDPHHVSGLSWAYDTFNLLTKSIEAPPSLRNARKALNLPFQIYPGFVQDLPELSVSALEAQVDFRSDDIRTTATNRVIKERRLTAWEGDESVAPFAYSGKCMDRADWSPLVRQVRDQLACRTDQYYDGCLLNLYPNGESGMRYHIDPDQGTLWDFDTAVVSVGAARRFSFREIPPSDAQPHNFVVFHGDVTYMFADCQQKYQHTVKKADNKREPSSRASLVFKRTWKG